MRNCLERVAPTLGRLLCYLFSFDTIICRLWKKKKWSYRSRGRIPFYKRGSREAESWGQLHAGEQACWPRSKVRGFAGICFVPGFMSYLPQYPHLDIIAMLQEVIYCNFRSLSLSIVMMCFANIGSGGCHKTSLLGEAAVREKKNFTDYNLTPYHKCFALCLPFPCHSLCCWLWTLQVDSTRVLGLNHRSDSNGVVIFTWEMCFHLCHA